MSTSRDESLDVRRETLRRMIFDIESHLIILSGWKADSAKELLESYKRELYTLEPV